MPSPETDEEGWKPFGYYDLQRYLQRVNGHNLAAQKQLRHMRNWARDFGLENPLPRPRPVVDNTRPNGIGPPEPTDAA